MLGDGEKRNNIAEETIGSPRWDAGLLAQEGYEVKALKRGRWEVRGGAGKAAHSFANDTELWRWAYVLVMDGADLARALPGARRIFAVKLQKEVVIYGFINKRNLALM